MNGKHLSSTLSIGWLNSVEIIDEPITARVDKHSQVEIGSSKKSISNYAHWMASFKWRSNRSFDLPFSFFQFLSCVGITLLRFSHPV
jgi:hypothetical protein